MFLYLDTNYFQYMLILYFILLVCCTYWVLGELPCGKFPRGKFPLVKIPYGEFTGRIFPRGKLAYAKLPRIY